MKRLFRIAPPRREDGTMLPAVLLAVLVLMGALQLSLTGGVDLPEADVARVGLPAPELTVTRAVPAPVILGRPLFGPGRGTGSGMSSGGASVLGGATVAGSMTRGRQKRLFLREANGTVVTLAPGGTYRGWRVVAITEEGARFARGSETMTINYGSQAPEADAGEDEPEEE